MLAVLCLIDGIFFLKIAEDIVPNTAVGQKACGRGPDKDSEAEMNSFASFFSKGF